VLIGHVRGCSYCFQSTVELVSFNGTHFKNEFSYGVDSRDWNDGVEYDHQTQTINIDYQADDLTPYCGCSDQAAGGWIRVYDYNCKCKYTFNGQSFELVDESVVKTMNKDEEDRKEVLSFKIAKNQKELKLLVLDDETLHYAFLKPNGVVEFSYPIGAIEDSNHFTISQNEDKLSFDSGNNSNITYQIYEERKQGALLRVGVLVTVNGKEYDLKGDINSLKGSLSNAKLERLENVIKE